MKKALLLIPALIILIAVSSSKAQPKTEPTITQSPEALGQATEGPKPTKAPSNREKATLVRVVDGDTIDFSINGKTERVRVIGINTPETVDPRKSVECFGKEASNKAKEILTSGLSVELEVDPSQDNQDKYNRLLRYVFINGSDYGKKMISDGYAYEYTYDIPYKYQVEYKQAQKEAEAGKKGLWADDACVATPKPTTVIFDGSWPCDCSKACTKISSCAEAQYLLNICGCKARDGDSDGVACDGAPLNCQH